MNIHNVYAALARRFRTKRMEQFASQFAIDGSTTILDIGGSIFNWQLIDAKPKLILLNIDPPPAGRNPHGRVLWVTADARDLPFEDQSIEIGFSNSVIEHLGNWDSQRKFASEIRRVCRAYYVQTPNRQFPIEPHYLTPGIHYLSDDWQRRLLRNFTVMGWMNRPSHEESSALVDEIRLLDAGELQELFPDGELSREKFLGLTKSLIAVKLPIE